LALCGESRIRIADNVVAVKYGSGFVA